MSNEKESNHGDDDPNRKHSPSESRKVSSDHGHSSKRDSGRSGSSNNRDRDEKSAKDRGRRKDVSTPGATYETSGRSSGRSTKSSRSDRDNKSKESSRSRASKPGASYERSPAPRDAKRKVKREGQVPKDRHVGAENVVEGISESRSARKEKRERERRNRSTSDPPTELGLNQGPDGDMTEISMSSFDPSTTNLEASIVADDSEKQKRLEEMEARIQRQLEEINRASSTNQREGNNRTSVFSAKQDQARPSSSKKTWMILAAFIVLVCGGVTAYFVATKSSSSSDDAVLPKSPLPLEDAVFNPPSQEDCEAIANQQPVPGQGNMPNQTYFIDLDLQPDSSFNLGLDEFASYVADAVESEIVPELVGCPAAARKLIRSSTLPSTSSRALKDNTEYIIRNVAVNAVGEIDKSCEDGSDTLCKRITVTLVAFLQDSDVRRLDVVTRIKDAFDMDSLVDKLRLSSVAKEISFVGLRSESSPTQSPSESPTMGSGVSLSPIPSPPPTSTQTPTNPDPTEAPVEGPTPLPALSPTSSPTSSPSARPTSAPVAGPSPTPPIPEPTRQPTGRPTLAPVVGPSPPPTPEPTRQPTGRPTLAPVVGPSPPPTPEPTLQPTQSPTKMPTPIPTFPPTPVPTPPLTPPPTAPPTPNPTPFPTQFPTKNPTPYPTPIPTPFPTKNPTPYPTTPPPTKTPNWGACTYDADCQSTFCSWNYVCEPMRQNGQSCVEDDDCVSGHCGGSLTCSPKKQNGERCVEHDDCVSNYCATYWSGFYCA